MNNLSQMDNQKTLNIRGRRRMRPPLPVCCMIIFVIFSLPSLADAGSPAAPVLKTLPLSEIPQFTDDLHYQHLAGAVRGSMGYYEKLPPEQRIYLGDHAFTARHMHRSMAKFLGLVKSAPPPEVLRAFVCAFYQVYAYQADGGIHPVLFTGYYEPLLSGSRHRSGKFRHPVYGRPDDLVVRDGKSAGGKLAESEKIGRNDGSRFVSYYTRRQITAINPSDFNAPVIAWTADPVELFFLHIQGSGKIRFADNDIINVHFQISNGHPYKSIGKYLIDHQKLSRETVSMQSIRAYLYAHPEAMEDVFNYNPRYVFFETTPRGPVGCFNVELTPGRSVALDRQTAPAGALAFVETRKPACDPSGKICGWPTFSRFFLNQDTGSAIKGPGRADIFWGSGAYAELAAGHLQHPGKLYFLVLKPGI